MPAAEEPCALLNVAFEAADVANAAGAPNKPVGAGPVKQRRGRSVKQRQRAQRRGRFKFESS